MLYFFIGLFSGLGLGTLNGYYALNDIKKYIKRREERLEKQRSPSFWVNERTGEKGEI